MLLTLALIGLIATEWKVEADSTVSQQALGLKVQDNTLTNRVPQPPVPISAQTPADFFEALLKLSPAELEQYLQERPEPQRTILRARVAEFSQMSEFEREVRLRIWRLRYYFGLLVRIPASGRESWIKQVPEPYRWAVAERLESWDRLPEQIRKDILENERILEFLLPVTGGPPLPPHPGLASLQGQQVNQDELRLWEELPPERRKEVLQEFGKLFSLSDKERLELLRSTANHHRERIRALLTQVESMSASDRELCLRALERLASMPPDEQVKFFKKAEIWIRLSPDQRRAWRQLMDKLPPLPPLPNTNALATQQPEGSGNGR